MDTIVQTSFYELICITKVAFHKANHHKIKFHYITCKRKTFYVTKILQEITNYIQQKCDQSWHFMTFKLSNKLFDSTIKTASIKALVLSS